jgi:hypothetical protein
MTARIAYAVAAIAAAIAAFQIATAPALWWMSEAEKTELIDRISQTHGAAEAAYVATITNNK